MIKISLIPPKPATPLVKIELELTVTQAAILKSIIGRVGGNMPELQSLAGPLYRALGDVDLTNAEAFNLHNGSGGIVTSQYYDKK